MPQTVTVTSGTQFSLEMSTLYYILMATTIIILSA